MQPEYEKVLDSIQYIERFAPGYPKKIEAPAKWQEFFDKQYELCRFRAAQLEELSTANAFHNGTLEV